MYLVRSRAVIANATPYDNGGSLSQALSCRPREAFKLNNKELDGHTVGGRFEQVVRRGSAFEWISGGARING